MVKEVATAVASNEMIRSAAARIAAEVTDFVRQLTSSQIVTKPMRINRLAINTKPSIARGFSSTSPFPTAVIGVVRDWA